MNNKKLNKELNEESDQTIKEKISKVVENELINFWVNIAKHFPEIRSGDIDPLLDFTFSQHAEEIVNHWYEVNKN